MITQQKIKVFEQCGGDADGIGRVLPDSTQEIFDKDAWSTIIGIYQDIEMIKNNVVSDNYKQRVIQGQSDVACLTVHAYILLRLSRLNSFVVVVFAAWLSATEESKK